ncbi:hypothetical protein V5O48_014029 [Marasmius crinis-equi]|uniref:Uncharacterized protein n=1 Tax=Marasmius crinis-equi TaxID=585013 RepID=A0ABR3EYG7_9AGAR
MLSSNTPTSTPNAAAPAAKEKDTVVATLQTQLPPPVTTAPTPIPSATTVEMVSATPTAATSATVPPSFDDKVLALVDECATPPSMPGPSTRTKGKGKAPAPVMPAATVSQISEKLPNMWKGQAQSQVNAKIKDLEARLTKTTEMMNTGLHKLHDLLSQSSSIPGASLVLRVDYLTQYLVEHAKKLGNIERLLAGLDLTTEKLIKKVGALINGNDERPHKRANTGVQRPYSIPNPSLTPMVQGVLQGDSITPAVATLSTPMPTAQAATALPPAPTPVPVPGAPYYPDGPVASTSYAPPAPALPPPPPQAPAPVGFNNNNSFSVWVGPIGLAGVTNYHGVALAIVRSTHQGHRLSHRVRDRREGADTLIMTWRTAVEARAFFDAWFEEVPWGYESVSVSLGF